MDGTKETVEAPLEGPDVFAGLIGSIGGYVPFTGHVGFIVRQFHDLGNRQAVFIQVAAIALKFIIAHHMPDPGLVLIEAGQKRRASGTAAGGVIKLGKTQAIISQAVEVRRFNFTAVTANVGITHIIRHDQDYVGSFSGGGQGATGIKIVRTKSDGSDKAGGNLLEKASAINSVHGFAFLCLIVIISLSYVEMITHLFINARVNSVSAVDGSTY